MTIKTVEDLDKTIEKIENLAMGSSNLEINIGPTDVKCDNCGKILDCSGAKEPWDAIKYACDKHKWFFGGCNITLLCDSCKYDNPWYNPNGFCSACRENLNLGKKLNRKKSLCTWCENQLPEDIRKLALNETEALTVINGVCYSHDGKDKTVHWRHYPAIAIRISFQKIKSKGITFVVEDDGIDYDIEWVQYPRPYYRIRRTGACEWIEADHRIRGLRDVLLWFVRESGVLVPAKVRKNGTMIKKYGYERIRYKEEV